jgi:hypothetical protein
VDDTAEMHTSTTRPPHDGQPEPGSAGREKRRC